MLSDLTRSKLYDPRDEILVGSKFSSLSLSVLLLISNEDLCLVAGWDIWFLNMCNLLLFSIRRLQSSRRVEIFVAFDLICCAKSSLPLIWNSCNVFRMYALDLVQDTNSSEPATMQYKITVNDFKMCLQFFDVSSNLLLRTWHIFFNSLGLFDKTAMSFNSVAVGPKESLEVASLILISSGDELRFLMLRTQRLDIYFTWFDLLTQWKAAIWLWEQQLVVVV
ncbi:hypothetical protein WICPIJ_004099 [Wickerhamomyces pijperi]|uniref:Uncharacterized protein n=1 Tax=Wickerhamomyces pijperi TaxID=599730 RepID=A0A9P8TN37_WICPI|nr:hypothetical protein WICPIJ_004099 [Wickerhamomyces pijperi]